MQTKTAMVTPILLCQGCDAGEIETCFDVYMDDSYGDGWNGGALSIYIDGDGLTRASRWNAYSCSDCTLQTAGISTTLVCLLQRPSLMLFCVSAGQFVTVEYVQDSWDTEMILRLLRPTA